MGTLFVGMVMREEHRRARADPDMAALAREQEALADSIARHGHRLLGPGL